MKRFSTLVILVASVSSTLCAYSPTVQFVPAKEFASGKYNPQDMAAVEQDGTPVYIGRIQSGEGHFVGMYNQKFKGFFYADEGAEKGVPLNGDNVQVLVYPTNAMTWSYRNQERTVQQYPPPNMAVLGFDSKNGEPLYACRVHGWGHIHLGILKMSDKNGCLITRSNKLFWNAEMEIMSLSLFGIASQSVD